MVLTQVRTWCKHRFKHVNIDVNMQKDHFVCIILCEIFLLTLLCHTYIFLHIVCIILCELFILTLFCHTYMFLHFVCIILCEIFILTLFCHTYIGCQFVSILFHAFHTCLVFCRLCTQERMFNGNFTERQHRKNSHGL